MNYNTGRLSGAREALRKTLGRPLALFLVLGSSAVVLAAVLLGALAYWRFGPMEPPAWARPQALVLVGGAEGEVDLAAAGQALRQIAQVASAEFVGRDAALADLAQRRNLAGLGLKELRPNPLPDAFVVRFVPGATPNAVEAAVAQMRTVKDIGGVEYQASPFRKLNALRELGRRLVLLLAVFLAAAAAACVTLAAAFWCRVDSEEVRVLHLLGADPAAMRRPYVYAGALSLALAALMAWVALDWVQTALEPFLATLAQQYALALPPRSVPPWAGAAFVGSAGLTGAVLASIATRLALRRSLRA